MTDDSDDAAGAAVFAAVSLDCADPAALAGFWLALLGGEVLWRSPGSVGLRVPGTVLVAQLVRDYRPPVWPGTSVLHLDLGVRDVAAATARAIRAGATDVAGQPDPRWRVLLDPAGHPFCLTTLTPPGHELP